MTRAVEHVDPVVGIAWMDEDLVVLFVPGVELAPEEGHMVFEGGMRCVGFSVAPGRILDSAVVELQIPARQGGLSALSDRVISRPQEIGPHVRKWEVVDGQPPGLEDELDLSAVCNRNPVQKGPNATWRGFDTHRTRVKGAVATRRYRHLLDWLRHRSLLLR